MAKSDITVYGAPWCLDGEHSKQFLGAAHTLQVGANRGK
jgi:hypothetical protein